MAVRILIVDDHKLVRAGLQMLLQREPEFVIVGEAESGAEAISLSESLQPDIALVDLTMPGMTGWQVLSGLKEQSPAIKVIILSVHSTEEHVVRALRAGACGYVLKEAAPQELISAVRTVQEGGTWLPSQLSRQVLDAYLRRIQATDPPNLLTTRQREILRLIADGASTNQIAGDLEVSVKTVESHRAQIMAKLDIHDTAGLVRYAIRHGISEL
jgi:DNA-binding NarL/FixJ family response regulator